MLVAEMPAPSIDVTSSVITQVAKDGENNNCYFVSEKGDDESVKVSNNKEKKSNQKKLIRSMFCCFGKPKRKFSLSKISLQDEPCWAPAPSAHPDVTPPPTPTPIDETDAIDASTNLSETEDKYLLPENPESIGDKKCAVIDLDETLVHSSFQPISNADFIVPVEIEGTIHQVYVLKRPHVDTYLQRMGEMFECILFTASLSKYADPVADLLDKEGVFSSRLFRESCVLHRGNYVKDLSVIGRDLNDVIIIDNSPASYIFHPDNAVPILSWFDDPNDRELLDLLPYLEAIAESDNVYSVLRSQGFTSQAMQTTATIQHDLQQQEQQRMNNVQPNPNELIHNVER